MKPDPAAKQISRAEMEALIAERCPRMSDATKQACLTGSVLQLSETESYQAPQDESRKPTHRVAGVGVAIEGDPKKWN